MNLEPDTAMPSSSTEEVSEEKMGYAMYLFDFVAFSVHGRGGVSGLDFSMLIALCRQYIPNFSISPYYLPTRSELLQLLRNRVCTYLFYRIFSTNSLHY